MQASLADPDDLGRSHMPTPSVPEMEGEISFDQSECLTARLRDLVRQYPKGPGLVKEFLQNADDAGASKLLVVLDRRTHDSGHLPPDMRAAQGPALLFFNDRVFSEDDFKRIQQVGAGGKVEEAAGTGRFGHGFNTCYSVSDHPSLLTGERVAWFDPHHSAACEDTPQKNARAWIVESKSGRERTTLPTHDWCSFRRRRCTGKTSLFKYPEMGDHHRTHHVPTAHSRAKDEALGMRDSCFRLLAYLFPDGPLGADCGSSIRRRCSRK